MRRCRIFCLSSCWMLTLLGCSHTLETRTITAFVDSLEKADLEDLKTHTSTDFQTAALRRQEATEALKLMNLPAGKIEVKEVKEESAEVRKVLAEVGEQKRKMIFTLLKDEDSGKWVVDDIHFKKKLKPGQVNKPISEQMDLLLSVTDIVAAWQSGQRSAIERVSTAELQSTIASLPEGSLRKIATSTTEGIKLKSMSPRIDAHKNSAVAKITRRGGTLTLTLVRSEDQWKVSDLAVVSQREGEAIPSLKKYAAVLQTANEFYDAYQKGDKARLEKASNARFYRLNLAAADLSQVPLPTVPMDTGDVDVRVILSRAEVIAQQGDEILRITLSQGAQELIDEDNLKINQQERSLKPYLVEDVTIHEIQTQQEKRLTSLFSSQAIVGLFAEALANRDLKAIRMASTTEFNTRVWQRVKFEQFDQLPVHSIPTEAPVIVETSFKGSITEVTVNQGETPLTYVLREQGGTMLVDDILRPALDEPPSLKTTLELLLPFYEFRMGIALADAKVLRTTASREFNQMVFFQMEAVPHLPQEPTRYLRGRVTRMQVTPDRAILTVGDERFGAKIFMNREVDAYMVDDVILISGLEQAQRVGLKQLYRGYVVEGTNISANPRGFDDPVDELMQEVKTK